MLSSVSRKQVFCVQMNLENTGFSKVTLVPFLQDFSGP